MREYVPPPNLKFVEANGLRHAYLEEGEGPLVLLFHGFPDTPQTWDDVRPALAAAGFRAVSPFLRGYAPSEIPDSDTTSVDLGQDALALITALGEERAILVGHDWGTDSVYAAASLDASRVSKLVAVGIPHRAGMPARLGALWAARHFIYFKFPGAVRRFQSDDFAHIRVLYERWSPTWDVPETELEATKNTFAAPGSANAALGYYRELTPRRLEVFRPKIDVPTLVVAGVDDPALTVDDYERARRKFTRGYEVCGLPGGHFVHRESPEAFIRELLAFLGPPSSG